ncbi:MAG TPA: urease accessory protein UreE [Xanthobacteraceae bacterium]|nr:urease accessory protein UreE [Xanthobacteraceae bacterium]
MRRAVAVKPADTWDIALAVDRVVLDANERHRRRVVLTGEGGTVFLLDLPRPVMLKDGDGLVLEDFGTVQVVGRLESLVAITAGSAEELARLAWHIGNRHIDMQVIGNELRIRRDHVLEDMLLRLGARLLPMEAAFYPEGGAYDEREDGLAHKHA